MAIEVLEKISKELNIEIDKLVTAGVRSYIEKEIRLALEDRDIIRERYDVKTIQELEEKIREKVIPSHPAWEDLIQWENIEKNIAKLQNLLNSL